MSIPAKLHFCWIGPRLPWAYVFAILSAVERSELRDITLHHTDKLEEDEPLRQLRSVQCVRLQAIDAKRFLLQTGQAIGLDDQLAQLYTTLELSVMRADLLRAAILYTNGGLYLDLDTLTVASLRPLLVTKAFLGSDIIVWPSYIRQSRSPLLWFRHLLLDVIRKVCRWAPFGWQAFRRLQTFYVRNVTNAIMGAEPHSPFFADYLKSMALKPTSQLINKYALGPTLLQEIADRYTASELHIQEPSVFSPLPPEVSEHWFHILRRPALYSVLLPETRVVHWYASVRTSRLVAQITPAYILKNHQRQLYSALAYSCVGKSSAVFDR